MIREYPKSLRDLIEHLKKIPGIGGKNAERMAFFFIYSKEGIIDNLITSLSGVKENLQHCPECFSLMENDKPCFVCSDYKRDRGIVCVVENFKDIFLFEDTLEYKGLYHVLEGKLAPLEGMTPQKLRLAELVERVKTQNIEEVIIATSLDTDGDATAFYITRLLKDLSVKVTRLAKGLPFGLELEYADSLSLVNSLKNREILQ